MVEKNKTVKEILNGKDENEILGILRDWIYEGDEYKEQKKKEWRFCQNIRNAVVHPDYPLHFKYFLPLTRKAIVSTKADSIQQQFATQPFWGQIRAKNETKDKIEAKLIQAILETNTYDFNNFLSEMDKVEEEKLIYGTGIIKDTWKYRVREVKHAIKENLKYKEDIDDNVDKANVNINNQNNIKTDTSANPNLNIENNINNQNNDIQETEMGDNSAQSSTIEFDETVKSDIEVIEDCNCLKYVSIWNITFDPSASKKQDCRYIFERRYFDEDELKEMFANYEDYAAIRKVKENSNQNSQSQNFDFNQKDGTTTNEEERRNTMTEVIEFYCFDKLFWTTADCDFLFIPVNTTAKTKFWNPYNHCEYPYSLVYYIQDNYSIYGRGMVVDEGLGELNLAANNLFNLAMEGVFKKANAPLGINKQFADPTQVKKAMSTFGGFFEIINNPQSANQIMYQPQLNYSEQELFNFFQAMDGYIQTFSNQTNFQTGGTDVKGYNKTLGGILEIKEAAKQKISYANKINQSELKNMIFRMISNIFQFTKENIVVEVMEDDGISFYELTTKYNNHKAKKFTGINKKNYKVYSLDEIAKLKYSCKIDFAIDDGNKYIRNQKLQQALATGMQLIPLGVDVKPIVQEYFETLNINGVMKDTQKEMAKIKRENWQFVKVLNDANMALANNKINKPQYDLILRNAVLPPTEDDNDVLHLENHNPDMIEHNNIHKQRLLMKQQIAEQLQAQAKAAQGETNNIDGRTAVSVAGQDNQMQNPERQVNENANQGVM